MNVLSLFDGMSCGQLALDRLGVKVDNYYASEIDKHAITIAFLNYPNTVHLGDVTKWREWNIDWKSIGLVLGGSPCQGFSFAGKQLNFDDPRSKLFFVYVDILNHIKSLNPNVIFLLENVHMKKEYEDVITQNMGVAPIKINSALVSAQNRKRIYWTNMPNAGQPEDKGILLKHIVHEYTDTELSGLLGVYPLLNFNVNPSGKGMNGNVRDVNNLKATCLTTNKGEGQKIAVPKRTFVFVDKAETIKSQYAKSSTANFIRSGSYHATGVFEESNRYVILQIPEATKKGYVEVEVGDGVDTTFLNSKTRRGRLMKDKSNCLTAANYDYGILEELKQYIVPFDKTLQILDKEIEKGKVGYFRKDSQANRVYFIHDKAVTLCGDAGDGAAKKGQCLFGEITREVHQVSSSKESGGQQPYMQNRVYNSNGISPALTAECGRLNVAIENDYLFGCITPDRVNKRQNGQRFSEGKKFYTLTAQDQHGVLIEGYIRKLTPIECERLQTVPDNYTAGVSNSQRYKMLGNGWTIDVICHLLEGVDMM